MAKRIPPSRSWSLMERNLWLEFATQPRMLISLIGTYSMRPAQAAVNRLEAAGFVEVTRMPGVQSVWVDARIPADRS